MFACNCRSLLYWTVSHQKGNPGRIIQSWQQFSAVGRIRHLLPRNDPEALLSVQGYSSDEGSDRRLERRERLKADLFLQDSFDVGSNEQDWLAPGAAPD